MKDLGKVKGAGGVDVDMRELMHRWIQLDSWDSSVTGVRQAVSGVSGFGHDIDQEKIDDGELKRLQRKIRREKGRLRKNFPAMKWYFK